MKICLLGTLESIHFKRWVEWFYVNGHEVHVVAYENDIISKNYEGVSYHPVEPLSKSLLRHLPKSSRWARIPQFNKIIRTINPDVVIGHYVTYYGLPLAYCGSYPKVLVAWGSDILVTPNNSRFEMLVAKKSVKKSDLVISVAEHIKNEIVKWGYSADKIYVNSLGVDTSIFTPDGPKIETNKPTIISTRALEKIYDIGTLIKAIPMVKEKHPNVMVWIFGEGKEKDNLKALVKKLKIEENIEFKGKISNNELPKHLRSADLYVSTSLSDGASISLFEAMACRIPVAVSDIPANRPWVLPGYRFITSNPNSLGDMINKIDFNQHNESIIPIEKIDWSKNMTLIEAKLKAIK